MSVYDRVSGKAWLDPQYTRMRSAENGRIVGDSEHVRNNKNFSTSRNLTNEEKTNKIESIDGIYVKVSSFHAIERTNERGVSESAIIDALTKPLYIQPDKIDKNGRVSRQYIGNESTVNINPDKGVIITVWKTGTRTKKKYKKEE